MYETLCNSAMKPMVASIDIVKSLVWSDRLM